MTTTIQDNMLILPNGSAPATVSTNELALYVDSDDVIHQKDDAGVDKILTSSVAVQDILGNSYGNNSVLRFPRGAREDRGSGDVLLRVIPRIPSRFWLLGFPFGNYILVGGSPITETGLGTTALEFKGTHYTRRYTTTAIAAQSAGWNTTQEIFRVQYEPLFSIRIHTAAVITNQRMWVGLFSAAPLNVAVLGTTQAVGFAYFSTDGNLSWVTSNGVTTTRTTILTMAADTDYLLTFWVVGSTAYFQINGGAIASTGTTLPAATTNLAFYVQVVNTTTIANEINVGNIYGEVS